MDEKASLRPDESSCPPRGSTLAADGERCNTCVYCLAGVRVYNPKHFILLACLFSAMVPIYLAASNCGKIGKSRTEQLWLALGFLGFVLRFTVWPVP